MVGKTSHSLFSDDETSTGLDLLNSRPTFMFLNFLWTELPQECFAAVY